MQKKILTEIAELRRGRAETYIRRQHHGPLSQPAGKSSITMKLPAPLYPPEDIMQCVGFMDKAGTIKTKPAAWPAPLVPAFKTRKGSQNLFHQQA